MKSFGFFLILAAALLRLEGSAATLATFRLSLGGSVGTIELELYDDQKPVTVSNFVKYVTSGRYENGFIHRWVTNFVIQGGGWRVDDSGQIGQIPTFGYITNEYSVGARYSNTYGTIAMARQGGNTNSATSQWFLNLKDNSFLDNVDGGFTVFGRVLSGTEVLDLFVPPPPANGIHFSDVSGVFNGALPVTSTEPTIDDLVYVDISLRRDMNLALNRLPTKRVVTWDSVAGVQNIVQFSTNSPPVWQNLTTVIGTGARMTADDTAPMQPLKFYRVILEY